MDVERRGQQRSEIGGERMNAQREVEAMNVAIQWRWDSTFRTPRFALHSRGLAGRPLRFIERFPNPGEWFKQIQMIGFSRPAIANELLIGSTRSRRNDLVFGE